MNILTFFPGQKATIFLETVDINGVRADGYDGYEDGYAVPLVNSMFLPNLTYASNYPQQMTKLNTGLYMYSFTLPTGAAAVGSYLLDVEFVNPINHLVNNQGFQIIVTAPFGQYGTTIVG